MTFKAPKIVNLFYDTFDYYFAIKNNFTKNRRVVG